MPTHDFRELLKITDLAEFAGDYIEFMRAVPENSACNALVGYAASFFTDIPVTSTQLHSLALMVVDRIYRYAASVTVKDFAVEKYFGTVTRYVLDVVAARGARVLYILDNELSHDRFELAVELMFRSGVFVVTPYKTDGSVMQLSEIRRALQTELLAGRHIAYIEKDGSVDYLRPVIDLARSTDRIVAFRNEAPTGSLVQLIASQLKTDLPS